MINVLYAGNTGVFDGILTSTLSMVKRLDCEKPITVNIFTMDASYIDEKYVPITFEQVKFLEKVLQNYNKETYVKLHDVTEIYAKTLKGNPNEGSYCSPYTLLRLLIDLTNIRGKILYLDADILFNKDVESIYSLNVDDYEFSASRDYYGRVFINPNYVNAGVILFNVDKCKETGLFEKMRNRINSKKMTFSDQTVLNRFATRKKIAPQRFNDQKFLYSDTVIRHFSRRLFYLPYPHLANIKQWEVDKLKKKFGYTAFDDVLNEYISLKPQLEELKAK